MEKLVLKWKHWYWYCLLCFDVFIPIFLVINRICVAKSWISGPDDTKELAMILGSSTFLLTLFLIYIFKALQEANSCRVIIKPTRFKYFKMGLLSSFTSFNLYIIAMLVSYKVGSGSSVTGVVYSFLVLCCILGTVSSCFLTMYEFCVSFDIFYNKNKETIIKEYLEHYKNKIKDNVGEKR